MRWLIAAVVILIVAGMGLVMAGLMGGPWARSLAERALREKFGGKAQVGVLHVSLFPTIRVAAEHVAVPQKDGTGALISITRVTGETNWVSALGGHVREVRLDGLRITIPPRRDDSHHNDSNQGEGLHQKEKPVKTRFTADHVIADGAVLEIEPKQAGKDPLEFDLYKLTLHGASTGEAMTFETMMKNARPPGEIHSTGKFGPWDFDEPAGTPVSGSYTFRDADLGVFKGISGTLSSDGNYHGVLDRIEVEGTTDTPNFALRVSGNPVDLACKFHAIVDGTNGNTYLDPVEGRFGRSTVIARGAVTREDHQHGRLVSLDATVSDGRLEDMLRLGMKSKDVMTGAIRFHSKIAIPPGDVEVAEKLQLDGAFVAAEAHFTKLNVQEKVNELSNRGRGDPQAGDTGDVASNFRGHFKLDHGVMTLTGLSFDVRGVRIALNGTYGLLDEKMDLNGTAMLQAKLSQTTTGWKSILLKVIDPLFKKKKAGAEIPFHISGTARSPRFGLSKP